MVPNTGLGAEIVIRASLKIGTQERAYKIRSRELLLLIKASKQATTNSLSMRLTNKRF